MQNKAMQDLTSEELKEVLRQKREQEKKEAARRREAYESLKKEFLEAIQSGAHTAIDGMKKFYEEVRGDTDAFYKIMEEYGQLRAGGQKGFSVQSEDFKIEVKRNNVKRFDERADIAASRLIEFLKEWIQTRQSGKMDPMYRLAMTLLERNKYGDLDYKSISKLYELEVDFDNEEYSQIMGLFRESNMVTATATNYYFYERGTGGHWIKMEPSFNRMTP